MNFCHVKCFGFSWRFDEGNPSAPSLFFNNSYCSILSFFLENLSHCYSCDRCETCHFCYEDFAVVDFSSDLCHCPYLLLWFCDLSLIISVFLPFPLEHLHITPGLLKSKQGVFHQKDEFFSYKNPRFFVKILWRKSFVGFFIFP